MSFFRQFPKVEYDFNRTGVKQNMVDLFRSVRPLPSFLDNYSAYKFYEIKNGERPDIISKRLYGTTQYYWTFFAVNEFLHDGYRAWPMSQEDLFTYIEKEYEGYVIETNPVITRDTDGLITNHRNSLSGRFALGETITGATSGATGTLTSKITDLSQLVVQNVTGAFIGDQTPGSNTTELVVGQTSGDSVSTYNVYKYAEAPYYYHLTNDADLKPVTNANHIVGGVDALDLSYVSNRSHVIEENDERSKLRYVDPNYINQFVNDFEDLINA
tara:strand:+ start:1014 stop:1826 length:813 start_codon:yes stop_codon:yes gene_type:complete